MKRKWKKMKKKKRKFIEPEMHWAIFGTLGYHQFTAKETMKCFLCKSD